MFKRVTWLGVGFTLGVGTTVVAARKARQQLDRYKPPALVDRVTTTITTKTTTLKDQVVVALNEGRSAARDREPSSAKKRASQSVPDPLLLLLLLPRSSSPAKRQGRLSKVKRHDQSTHARRRRRRARAPTVGPVGGDPARRATPRNEACRGSAEGRARVGERAGRFRRRDQERREGE